MLQILDSSEIQEAIELACRLTGGHRPEPPTSPPAPAPVEEVETGGLEEVVTPALAEVALESVSPVEPEPVVTAEPAPEPEPEPVEKPAETSGLAAAAPIGGLGVSGVPVSEEVITEREPEPFTEESPVAEDRDTEDPEEMKKKESASKIVDITEALSSGVPIDKTAGQVKWEPSPELRSERKMELDLEGYEYSGDKLEGIIKLMCERSNFSGAVVTDDGGLPFAVVNPPVSLEALSAFCSVLGQALEKAGDLLGHGGAEYLSMDINYEEKVVLRRFSIGEDHYLLMAICSQDVDERSEIEVSIEQIMDVLAGD